MENSWEILGTVYALVMIYLSVGLILGAAVFLSVSKTRGKHPGCSGVLTVVLWPVLVAILVGGFGKKEEEERINDLSDRRNQ